MPARKIRYGQHFLTDAAALQALHQCIAPVCGDQMIEIGCGRGALTFELLPNLDFLKVVEIDERMIEALRRDKRFDANKIQIIRADACTLNWRAELGAQARLVGNLAYDIVVPLLLALWRQDVCVQDMFLMMQKEVAQRLLAPVGTKHYARISVWSQLRWQMTEVLELQADCFTPPPKVVSVLVRFVPREPKVPLANSAAFLKLLEVAFHKRRKTLYNATQGVVPSEAFERAGVDPRLRPQQLLFKDYLRLLHQPCVLHGLVSLQSSFQSSKTDSKADSRAN